ncbi:MAG TPA: hypothetical protein VK177_21045 [Flavobacteriales bacterium]|nr:hypothetical protein [Flavobacteriales bacterium]
MAKYTELNGNWNEIKAKLKQRFSKLTNNDILLIEGKQKEILERLQARLGKTKEELHKLITEL